MGQEHDHSVKSIFLKKNPERLSYSIVYSSFYGAGNCKWWHFYPDERLPALEEKFNEIMDTHKSGERKIRKKKENSEIPTKIVVKNQYC